MSSSDVLDRFLAAIDAGDDGRAEEAALALPSLGERAVSALGELLASGDVDRRWWATRGLAAIGTPAVQQVLIGVLEDDDPYVRACAAQGLGELRVEGAVPALVRHLGDDSPLVSRIAADGLGRIGPAGVSALIVALQEEDVATRAGAARALSVIQPEEAVPALCHALDDPSATVTHYATEALERMGVGLILFRP